MKVLIATRIPSDLCKHDDLCDVFFVTPASGLPGSLPILAICSCDCHPQVVERDLVPFS